MTEGRHRAGLPGFDDLLAGDQIAGAREYQEDDFRTVGFRDADPDGCDVLLVLADGMGGHRGGARASGLAVSTFVDAFRQSGGGVRVRLRAGLDAANDEIGRCASEDGRYEGMGCTLVACVVTDDGSAHWISVGDSPLWRVREGGDVAGEAVGLERLNADHSMRPVLERMVELGEVEPGDAEGDAVHQLRSALTGDELSLVDDAAAPVQLVAGDAVVLASDGLETLAPEEIRRLCGGARPAGAAVSDLLRAVEAAKRPTQDNATVVVYRHAGSAGVRRRFQRLTATTQKMAR